MKVRPRNGRWTIYPQPITTEPMKELYMRRVASGYVGGPQWKDVDRVSYLYVKVVQKKVTYT